MRDAALDDRLVFLGRCVDTAVAREFGEAVVRNHQCIAASAFEIQDPIRLVTRGLSAPFGSPRGLVRCAPNQRTLSQVVETTESVPTANQMQRSSVWAYSITSSARASSVGGTSRPRARAVLRLMTRSYLVGACTGRSAGFSPRNIRST
jgi:hypothetical protein